MRLFLGFLIRVIRVIRLIRDSRFLYKDKLNVETRHALSLLISRKGGQQKDAAHPTRF